MLEWFWMAVIAAIVGGLGGVLHIIIPPVDTDRWSVTRRIFAGMVVGFGYFIGGADPRKYGIPSPELATWFFAVIVTGYFAIDALNTVVGQINKAK